MDKKINIIVLGDMILDVYVLGESNRLSPEAPVPIIDLKTHNLRLGGAANVVNNLDAFGVKVFPIGVIGGKSAEDILNILENRNITSKHLVHEDWFKTPRKSRVMIGTHQICRIDDEAKGQQSNEESMHQMMEDLEDLVFDTPDLEIHAIVISDYGKGGFDLKTAQFAIHLANEKKIPVIVDSKMDNFYQYRGATVITPNAKELAVTLDRCGMDVFSFATSGGYDVVNTQAEKGMVIYSQDGSAEHIPSDALEVFDVSGAGDTVAASIAFKLALGESLSEACKFASKAAAVVVGKVGTATCTLDEINSEYPKVKTIGALSAQIAVEKAKGRKIVFTNGCFDLLHSGHVKLLQKAKQYGDILIVAINSDKSVQRLKGPNRPVISETERAHLIGALACVDYVIIFDEDTPEETLLMITPHVLVKGADYAGKDIVGSDLAESIVLVELDQDKSTSNIIKKIIDSTN